jgi:hypothetical protein
MRALVLAAAACGTPGFDYSGARTPEIQRVTLDGSDETTLLEQ